MTSPPRGRRTTTRSKTQILFLVQNVAYDNKFMIDYEVVKDQLPEEWHLVPTKPPHPKKIPVQTAQRRRPSTQTRRTGQFATRLIRTMGQVKRKYMKSMKLVWGSSITKLWKIGQEGRARQTPQRPEETSSQPT